MKNINLVIIILLISQLGLGQDIHFSQPTATPHVINPAFTGAGNAQFSLGGTYRNQWRSVSPTKTFETKNVFFDGRYCMKNNFVIGGGINFYHDQAGITNFITNHIQLSGSAHIKLNYRNKINSRKQYTFLGLGFGAGWAQKRLNRSALTFNDQFNTLTGNFDNNIPSSDMITNPKHHDWDIGTGIFLWHGGKQLFFNAGFALHHARSPRQNFLPEEEVLLKKRMVLHGGLVWKTNNDIVKEIGGRTVLQYQAPYLSSLISGDVGFNIGHSKSDKFSFHIGNGFRISGQVEDNSPVLVDAIIPSVGLNLDNFRISASYDINVSPLKKASGTKGGFELSIIQRFGEFCNSSVDCPKLF